MVKIQHNMVEILWLFFVMFVTEGFVAVYGKTGILLGNPDIPIERSHKKTVDEHGKFRYYVMFATMDMLIYLKSPAVWFTI
jgi:hypothetical protein